MGPGWTSLLDFPYQENNLPLMLTYEHFTRKALTVGLTFEDATVMATMDVTKEMNQNSTAPQRELMLWHQNEHTATWVVSRPYSRFLGTQPWIN
jgi:hypothetical protein